MPSFQGLHSPSGALACPCLCLRDWLTIHSHIFYQHQDLFDKQAQVDELVDDLAFTLGVNRADLSIVRLTSHAASVRVPANESRSQLRKAFWLGH